MFSPSTLARMDARQAAVSIASEYKRGNNDDITPAWAAGESRRNAQSSFWTDGAAIYSYGLMIGYSEGPNHKVIIDQRGRHSVTTSQHVGSLFSLKSENIVVRIEQPTHNIWV